MYKIHNKVKKFITETVKNWKVKLTVAGKTLAEVKTEKGDFLGDMLLPSLFVIAMIKI